VDDDGIPQAKVFHLIRDLDAKADRLNGVVTPLMEPGVGGRLTGAAIDPFDSNHFVIAGDLLGVGYSFDRGESWQRSQGLTGYEVGSITFDKKRPGVVWAATMSGPELSLNGGIVFERKSRACPHRVRSTSGRWRSSRRTRPIRTSTTARPARIGDWKTSTSDVSNYGKFYRFNVSTDTWTTLATVVADGNIHAAAVNADATCFLVGGSFGLRKSADGTTWSDISTATACQARLRAIDRGTSHKHQHLLSVHHRHSWLCAARRLHDLRQGRHLDQHHQRHHNPVTLPSDHVPRASPGR
jgi:hypothetical protein